MTAPTGPQTPAAHDLPAGDLPADHRPGSSDGVRAVVDLHAESLSVGTVERPYRRVVVRREVVTEEVTVVVTVRREVLRVEHEDLVADVPGPFVLRTSEELAAVVAEPTAERSAAAEHAAGGAGAGGAGAGGARPDEGGAATTGAAEAPAGRTRVAPRSFEVVLHEERPVVGVEVVPVERVVVRTARHEALGVVRAEVRHEEVELDGPGAGGPSSPTTAG